MMASIALEEKIEKIRLQNEKIRQRYEEVEADKKNAAKANALVQLVPSDDWPERREPPEFSTPPKNIQKLKSSNKDHIDRPQHYVGVSERFGKKDHKFSQGDGPPPDPKYNFLADSEREMRIRDENRGEEDKNRPRNKTPRGAARKRGGGMTTGSNGGGLKEAFFKDNRSPNAFFCKEESLPEYEAWRAERNRIDEARINRQKTAEGNWRREWDCNKVNVEKDISKKSDFNRKDSSNFDKRNNHYDSDYSNRGHTGNRTFHGSQKNNSHQDYRRPQHEQQYEFKRQSSDYKQVMSPTDDRVVNTFDKNTQFPGNYGNQAKGPLMSVKVNSPSIAGTGRVGPRQKSRVTYSDSSEADFSPQETSNFSRQKSFDEKTALANPGSGSRSTPKSPFAQRKKDNNLKSPYLQRKEYKNDELTSRPKNLKTAFSNKNEFKDQKHSNHYSQKPQRAPKRIQKFTENTVSNTVCSDAISTEYSFETSSDPDYYTEVQSREKTFNISDSYEINVLDEIHSSDLKTIDHFVNFESVIQNENDNQTKSNVSEANDCKQHIQSENYTKTDEKLETVSNMKIVKDDGDNLENIENNKFIAVQNDIAGFDDSFQNTEKNDCMKAVTSSKLSIIEKDPEEEKKIDSDVAIKNSTENGNSTKCESISNDLIEQINTSVPSSNLSKELDEQLISESIIDEKNDIIEAVSSKQCVLDLLNENDSVEELIKEEETQVSVSNEDEKNNTIQDEKNFEPAEIKNEESQNVQIDFNISENVDSKEGLFELNDKSTDSATIKNESYDDSGFADANEFFEPDESECNQIKNDSVSDLNKEHYNSEVTEDIINETFLKKDEEYIKSDKLDTTKESSENFSEICDNISAASGVTINSIEKITEVSEIPEQNDEKLENPTKDRVIDGEDIDEKLKTSKEVIVKQENLNEIKEEQNSSKETETEVIESE